MAPPPTQSAPTPSGARTAAVPSILVSSLNIDPSHSGVNPSIAPPTLTLSTTVTSTASATPSSLSTSSKSSNISTGAIIGLAVGIFGLLATVLVIFMSVRSRRRVRAKRARVQMRRKSWSRLDDNREPKPSGSREAAPAQDTNLVDLNTRSGDESFLSLNSTRGVAMHNQVGRMQPAPPSRNPFLTPGPTLTPTPTPARPTSHADSHIPNPFTSSPISPSPSPTPSQDSAYSSSQGHALPTTLFTASFTPRTPHYTHASTITASSVSDYVTSSTLSEFPVVPEMPGVSRTEKPAPVVPLAQRIRKTSENAVEKPLGKAAQKEARARELKAMQDLISALDERATQSQATNKPPPSPFLRVDTGTTPGTSRLSRGEGVVTPGGHSVQESDLAGTPRTGDSSWGSGETNSTPAYDNFPLPPAGVFRAALNLGSSSTQPNPERDRGGSAAVAEKDNGKADKGKGRATRPFWDE